MKYEPKKKQNKANWTQAFPDQQRRLHPERTAAGGVKARSGTEEQRMAVYRPIAEMFKHENDTCEVCCVQPTQDVHHSKGRAGLLLFDVRNFVPVCRACHTAIHDGRIKL